MMLGSNFPKNHGISSHWCFGDQKKTLLYKVKKTSIGSQLILRVYVCFLCKERFPNRCWSLNVWVGNPWVATFGADGSAGVRDRWCDVPHKKSCGVYYWYLPKMIWSFKTMNNMCSINCSPMKYSSKWCVYFGGDLLDGRGSIPV